jgi:hypothetical protein
MIEGLKLTVSGEELGKLLAARIDRHGLCADRWAREKTRTSEDETEDAPLLPERMCANEAECHGWRADVLRFIREHLDAAERTASVQPISNSATCCPRDMIGRK